MKLPLTWIIFILILVILVVILAYCGGLLVGLGTGAAFLILALFTSILNKLLDDISNKILSIPFISKILHILKIEPNEREKFTRLHPDDKQVILNLTKKLDELKEKLPHEIETPKIELKLIENPISKDGEKEVVNGNRPIFYINSKELSYKTLLLSIIKNTLILKYLKIDAREGYLLFQLEKMVVEIENKGLREFIQAEIQNAIKKSTSGLKWLGIFKTLDSLGYIYGVLNPILSEIKHQELNDDIIEDFTRMCENLTDKNITKEVWWIGYPIGKNYDFMIIKIGSEKIKSEEQHNKYLVKTLGFKSKYNSIFLLSSDAQNESASLIAQAMIKTYSDITYKPYSFNRKKGEKIVVEQIIHIGKKN